MREFYSTISLYRLDQLNYYKAICLYAGGYSKKEIIERLKISDRTLQHWFQKDEFKSCLNNAIAIVFKSIIAKSISYANENIDILQAIARDSDTPSKYRISAIRTIFDIIFQSESHLLKFENPAQKQLDEKIDLIGSYIKLQDVISVRDINAVETSSELKSQMVWREFFPDADIPKELAD